ncbi:MAG: cob(I)yrinic acid a,c-diamide adenosyltransferase [Gammaproteobacteria bacterium]|nr:MAG: cob(I)yrinic acid a,c-diamide adenosyltransferase [Gammaproteobacteria bacterium]
MGHRLSRIYTRTGDDGATGLADGSRIAKSAIQLAAMGDIDELNSWLGLLLCEAIPEPVAGQLRQLQHILFNMGSALAFPDPAKARLKDYTSTFEAWIDAYNAELPPLKEFILPGGNRTASICHVARTVCRRAERTLAGLAQTQTLPRALTVGINRLSDLLFVIARVLARSNGGNEVYWDREV